MNRLNKIIAFFIVVVFAVTSYLFIVVTNNKNEELGTKIIPETKKSPTRRTTDNFGYVVAKIENVDQDEMEYIELMKGLVVVSEDERKTKKVKITGQTLIEAPCSMLFADEELKILEEEGGLAESNEHRRSYSPESFEDKFCETDHEQLRAGDIVNIKEEKGEAKWIKKQ